VYSNKVNGETIRVTFTAPDRATESLLKGGPGSPAVKTVHVKGTRAIQSLDPFAKMQTVNGFKAKGSAFTATEPASTLYTAQRAPAVKGSVVYLVTLQGGYLVNVHESFDVHTPIGTQTGAFQYRVTSIGGQPVPGH
jgi:hypothetical protein